MEKIFAILLKIEEIARLVSPHLADELAEDIAAVKAELAKEPKDILKTLASWIKHHGNLPGTPETRAEAEKGGE